MPKYSVIDNNKNIEYRCCKEEAARIIGISSKQIGRWEQKALNEGRNREEFNHFEIMFTEFKEIKEKKGSSKRFKIKHSLI